MTVIWLILIAILHSKMELEIEGHGLQGGWARNLPTKRRFNKLTHLLLNKEITDYHIYMLLLICAIFHGYFFTVSWTYKEELFILGLLTYYFILEDYFWFVFNKKIGIKKFHRGVISWHKDWLGKYIPISYVWGIIIGIILFYLGR